ncbi:LysR family transcriptional regulator [Mesorhizobium sp.]|uniref:LysR family transcriptional regulator n=1 Tax=Mesorhizobium sp. TaxID=1871066 RepID=UPI000FE4843F|nr:LysR family transcriptional regulator [Mesorhizobium sp.]RWG07805.1 MAG: LysR family transcriptional regulator [Mesorhizobium sp.]RWH02884.1 MAG: LysR family transcriptional regulator [Mesorhizobium sp.]RWI16513.1 MAG: LysR family transcriptional regulator [Mesorhizobium sp.]RWN06259.1 MAG: LysR family transcriptional regulator [Mesorhizobium sp.]RWN08222.1 MAG: LysR family transcriptional regulator [Mesorhizobium sp.]
MAEETELSLNAVRAFVQVARDNSVTRASQTLGITQSSVSRHLAVLEEYFGAKLIERRGRQSRLTDFGRLFADAVAEPLDTILFTARRMRRNGRKDPNRLVVRTSLSTFAYTALIPNLREFSNEMGGVTVDVISSLSEPTSADSFDVLLSRDLNLTEPADRWDLYDEQLVCVGAPDCVSGRGLKALQTIPVISVTSRPDILPTWLRSMDLKTSDIISGARYDHHYLALPAVTTGQSLLVTPHIVVADLIARGLLEVLPGSRAPSGMQYRAYAIDRGANPEVARAFCRWLTRLCRKMTEDELAAK